MLAYLVTMKVVLYSIMENATGIWAVRQICRACPVLSQQPGEDFACFFGICQKSPYLCPRKQAIAPVTARQTTRSLTIKIYKIMTQKNEMSARALGMEELENVNGGIVYHRKMFKRRF